MMSFFYLFFVFSAKMWGIEENCSLLFDKSSLKYYDKIMTQETDNYKLEFVKKVLKSSKEKAKFSFKNTESFLKQIQNLPEESLKEYKNASRIKKTYKKSKNENIGGK